MKMLVVMSKEDFILFMQKSYSNPTFAAMIAIGFMFLFTKIWKKERGEKEEGIPGRLGLPFLGESFSFAAAINSSKGAYEFVRLRHLWHGPWFKTRVRGKIHVFAPSVEAARIVMTKDFELFDKGYFKGMINAVGKHSLFCVREDNHKRVRHLLSDIFSMDSLSKYIQIFDKLLCQRLSSLEKQKQSFSLQDFNMKIAFDVMFDMLMSIKDEPLLQQLETDILAVSEAMLCLPINIPGTKYYKAIKARERLMKTFEEIIACRMTGKQASDDFLQFMLDRNSNSRDEKLSDDEIKDNLITLLISGETTIAAAMMWAIKFLDENKEVLEKLRIEQKAISRNKPDDYLLTLDDLNMMSYGMQVMKETLRMANPVLWLPRIALKDCTIDGFQIKKGWTVNVDVRYIHTDPKIYKEPLKFNPSRFSDMQQPYSFLPFGLGARTCLGINMARVMMLVFLHRLTSKYSWTCDDPDPSLEKRVLVPTLRSGYPITLKIMEHAVSGL